MKTIGEWLQKKLGEPGRIEQSSRLPLPSPAAQAAGKDSPKPVIVSQLQQQRPPQQQGGGRPQGQSFRHPHRHGRHNRQQQPRPGQQQQRPPVPQGQPRPAPFPQGKGGGLKVYPLGGFEQVGRNCFVIEVDQDLYIIDLGLQFPDEDMLGIDYLIPDISSLKGRENRIKGILFTHGHLDHIGAVQHLLPALHFPPMYGTKLTVAFIKKRLDEAKMTGKAQLNTVTYGQRVKIGRCEAEFLRVTHSIPDSAAIALRTPYGTIMHTGDFKFDLTPVDEQPADFQRFAQLGKEGVLAIVADSTNVNKPGYSKSERDISETLHQLIRDAKGRVIISTFSSLLSRIQQIVNHAKTYNRKVFVSGRSMETNIEIAQNLGYLKAPRGLIRKVSPGMEKIPDREVLIITTGSQGEEMAGLARIGLGTHRNISVKAGDTVILSSNPIIGNERSVAKVVNNLHLKGAKVKTNAELALHTTGHGHAGDILLMHQLVRAKHIIPEHGEPHMCAAHADLARTIGYEENCIHMLTNGEILEFDQQGNARKSKQKHLIQDVIIDGLGSAGEGQRVLNDRKVMSSAGIIMLVLRVYSQSKRLVGDPDVLSRGLIYGSEQATITREVVELSRKAYEEAVNRGEVDRKDIKRTISGALYRYFDRKLDREPMVIPLIVEV
ncbi:MAG: ribonuclease J [Candidatus Peribacteraceae bacterium]|nr:ribonuclease J [Candidatus Peribacteraceae bacterium]MDD5741841.1 ribonuclease J [Candidatus Peribacteraceae bacterium]